MRSGVARPSLKLARERLRWTGHVLHTDEAVLREFLTFAPEGGNCGRGRPQLRFYDTIKEDMQDRNIEMPYRTQQDIREAIGLLAADRFKWRQEVFNL